MEKKQSIPNQTDRTQKDQEQTEMTILQILNSYSHEKISQSILKKTQHSNYVFNLLNNFGKSSIYYDNGQPWLIYWSIHSLNLLNCQQNNIYDNQLQSKIISFLSNCQSINGGFFGSPYSLTHLASTYAAVMALVEIGTTEALGIIDVQGMYHFLLGLRHQEHKGSFVMHAGGEEDLRAVYCAVVLMDLLNIRSAELEDGIAEYVASCQTYEGGFGSLPQREAHGGYTYCGLAALVVLKSTHKINMNKLIYWVSNRQLTVEGGFQGRTNKLVDGCYSFWQGAIFSLVQIILGQTGTINGQKLFHSLKLQMYLLLCCQHKTGGLLDKPGKIPDLYHTCYTLSGLSLIQREQPDNDITKFQDDNSNNQSLSIFNLFADIKENILEETDPVFNVCIKNLQQAKLFFKQKKNAIQIF